MEGMAFVDLVSVEMDSGELRVASAPPWSHLMRGERVTVETGTDGLYALGNVQSSLTVPTETEELSFIAKACGETLPLKRVMERVKYEKLDYPEGDD